MNILIYIPTICKAAVLITLIVMYGKDISNKFWSMLSEDGIKVSHKRVIAIVTTLSFIHISFMSVHYNIKIDTNILWAHIVLILTASAIASLADITGLFTAVKGKALDTNSDDPLKKN